MSLRSRIRQAEETRAPTATLHEQDDDPMTMTLLDLFEDEARRAMPALLEQIKTALLRASINEGPKAKK